MKEALKTLFSDLLSTIVFLVVFAVTGSALETTAISIGVGIFQIVIEKLRRRPVAAMQWLSMGLVLVFGGASLITHDSRFIMIKPTLIHFAVGAVMLKRGWLDRYLPEAVHRLVPQSVIIGSGYAWALSMFALGIANVPLALYYDTKTWALFNSVAPLALEFGGFGLQYVLFRTIVHRALRRAAPGGLVPAE
jgi:intracellular septation protein